jgi:hypothetical protein
MYSISIAFENSPTVWGLMFKDRKTADAAWHKIAAESPATVEDDFGQRLEIRRENISGLMFEDMELSKLALIERSLHQARTQVKAKQMADADPMLRTAMMSSGGPAIISPMGQGNSRPR